MRTKSLLALSLILFAACAIAQPPQGGAPGNARTVRGTVTAITSPFFTIKTEDGELWQVKLGPNARLVKGGAMMRGDRQHSNRDGRNSHANNAENPAANQADQTTQKTRTDQADQSDQQQPPQSIAAADIHVGDVLAAGGDVDPAAKKVNAAFGFVIDAATVQKLAADWGVTYIAGKVTAIDADNAKLTIQRPDGKTATIQADETTSFRKARESITLADIKVGDTITGRGAQKNGAFIAATLVVIDPNAHRGGEIIRKK